MKGGGSAEILLKSNSKKRTGLSRPQRAIRNQDSKCLYLPCKRLLIISMLFTYMDTSGRGAFLQVLAIYLAHNKNCIIVHT